jgi:dihydrofolate reductase
MRKVTYGAAVSLDGYITGPDNAIDWLHFSKDVTTLMGEYFKQVDTMLLGRKTYSAAEAMGGGGDDSGQFAGVETYVFSRTLKKLSNPGAHLVSDDAGAFVREMKRKKGKEICVMGGGELARSLFEAGVIDEVGLNIHPVLLGGGVPMFPPSATRVSLELLESRSIDGGCVYVTYRVVKSRA